MPLAIGSLIVSTLALEGAVASTAAALGVTTATVTSTIGSAFIIGASIGLQYALRPDVPKPENGSVPVRQAIPPRIMGYGRNRLAGYFMCFEAKGPYSFDVLALHSGRVGGFANEFYFHDDLVRLDPSNGRPVGWGIRYETTAIGYRLGAIPEVAYDANAAGAGLSDIWTADHRGDGIASMMVVSSSTDGPNAFTRRYPRGPISSAVSAVVDCAPIFNPWDASQSRVNLATWQVSSNPVLQLIDYLTRVDGGLGLDYNVLFPAERLAQWYEEYLLCAEAVGKADGSTEPRYACNGWFTFDTKPEDVINQILATCDGGICEAGDGTFALKVGVYREPMVTLSEEHFLPGFSLSYGQPDEQLINQLDYSFTDPAQKYVEVQPEPYRDEESISEIGIVRAQQLSLKWVHSQSQADRLAARAMQRVNPKMTGSFTTTLYGLRAIGKRWVRVRYPFVSGLQDSVVEITGSEIDLLGGKCTFQFSLILPDEIEAYDPEEDESVPVLKPPPTNGATTADTTLVRADRTTITADYV